MKEYKKELIKNNILEIINKANGKDSNKSVIYLEKFNFLGTNLQVSNLYILKEENKDGKSISLFLGDSNNLIATVDETGEIQFKEEYLEELKDKFGPIFEKLDLEKAYFDENIELEKNDFIAGNDEIQEMQNEEEFKKVSEKLCIDEIKAYSEIDSKEKNIETKRKNMGLDTKQEVDVDTRVTQTESLADIIPEAKEKGFVKIGIVYSDNLKGKSNARFSIVGITKEGNIEEIQSLENREGTTTGQNIMSINDREGNIEEENVHGIFRIKGRNERQGQEEMISVKIGQYGTLEVDYVRAELNKDKEERYISAPIETHNIRPTTRETRDFMDRHKNISMSEEINKAKPELERDGEINRNNIDDNPRNDELGLDDVIVLKNGNETSLRKEAMKAKVSPEEFKRIFEGITSDTIDGRIEETQEEIESEFGATEKKR